MGDVTFSAHREMAERQPTVPSGYRDRIHQETPPCVREQPQSRHSKDPNPLPSYDGRWG